MKHQFNINLQLFNEEEQLVNPLLEGFDIDEENEEMGELQGEPIGEQTEPMPDNLENQNNPSFEGGYPQGEPPAMGNPQGDPDIRNYLDERFNSLQASLMNQNQNQGNQYQEELQEEPELGGVEKLGIDKEEFESKFYDDPITAIYELAEKIADSKVSPIVQEREQQQAIQEMDNQFNQFKMQNPDVMDYIGDMIQIIESKPYLQDTPDALDIAYKMAKFDKVSNAPSEPQRSLDDLAQDEQLKERIIREYLQNVDKNNQGVPDTITKASGSYATTPKETPKDLKDASRMFLNSLK